MSEALLGSELDAMVIHYLAELAHALKRLPASQRDHLVGEIREHIAELRAQHPVRDRSDMEALLNRVGLPEDIAAVALEGEIDMDMPVTDAAAVASTAPRRISISRRAALAALGVAAAVVVLGIALAGLAGAFTSGAAFQSVFALNRQSSFAIPAPTPRRVLLPASITVPNVVGEFETAAEETLIAAGLSYRVQSNDSTTVPSGSVIAQVPASGSSLRPPQNVLIIVSAGPPA
jgi:hypothetical protein